MNIINAGYKILTPINGITELQHIEKIGRVCYKSEDRILADGSSAKAFVRMLIMRGHEAMIEHSSLSVTFIVDRGVSHELVRHRIASFAQESTRYCNYGKSGEVTFIKPSWFTHEPNIYIEYNKAIHDGKSYPAARLTKIERAWVGAMDTAADIYLYMLANGASPQEARSVLPNSLKTEVVVTANYREWRNFFKLRVHPTAHPQMREVTIPLLQELQQRIPIIFDDIKISIN